MKKLLIGLLLLLTFFAGYLAYARSNSVDDSQVTGASQTLPSSSSQETAKAPTGQEQTIKVFFAKDPATASDPSVLVGLKRITTEAQIGSFAIEQLLKGPSASEQLAGYYTKVAVRDTSNKCGGKDFTLIIQDGTATLQFCRTFDASGTFADAIAQEQITQTLKQFSTVDTVMVLTSEGNCLFDQSGKNLCFN